MPTKKEDKNKKEEIITGPEKNEGCQPLGIIFDIDGTLIAEGKRIHGVHIRPGTIELLSWCKERGHGVALWTVSSS